MRKRRLYPRLLKSFPEKKNNLRIQGFRPINLIETPGIESPFQRIDYDE
jgi:hypothetical protein